jgi:hypothetical protein
MFPIDTASIAGRSSADMMRRNPRQSPLTLASDLSPRVARHAGRRRDALPAKVASDGSIILSAKDIVGTPRWGVRYGDEANALDDTATCLSGDRARNCALAPIGDPDRTTPPASCTLYLRRRRNGDVQRVDQTLLSFVRSAAVRRAAGRQHLEPRHLGDASPRDVRYVDREHRRGRAAAS